MNHPTYVLLYVADPLASADFYHRLLGAPIVERAASFSLLVLPGGLKLGLWLRNEVAPQSPAAGSMELAVSVETREAVEAAAAEAKAVGAAVLETPRDLDFGYALLFADADGHRWRVFTPS
jgi:catechol 2,3-dioxygenase-like lactoylglutathione lyase family enzyme